MTPRITAPIVLVCVFALLAGCSADPEPISEAEWSREAYSEVLLDASCSSDAAIAARAVLAMGRIQSLAYTESLVSAAASEDRQVRLAALFALGQIGFAEGKDTPDAAALTCANATRDEDPGIAAAAVECLGKLGAAGTEMIVVPLAKHDDPRVRAAVADALMRLRFVPVLREESETPPPFAPEAVEALTGALEDPDETVRIAAAHAVSRYGEPTVAPRAAEMKDEPNEFVRMFAVRCVARSDAKDLADAITWGLADPSYRVRVETINALARFKRLDLLPGSLAEDDSFHVRAAYATAVGAADDKPTLDRLRAMARDDGPTVRTAAIGSLAGRLQDRYATALSSLLDEENWVIRAAAAGAATRIGERGAPVLKAFVNDEDPRVAATALASVPLDDMEKMRRVFTRAIESDDQSFRAAAVTRIPEIASPETLGWLVTAYDLSNNDGSTSVRELAVEALAKIETDTSNDLLRNIFDLDRKYEIREKAAEVLRGRGIELPDPEPVPYEPPPVRELSPGEDPVVVLETTKGMMEIQVYAQDAPLHAASFVGLVKDGFYDGKIWHRVVSNFVIQGGDPEGNGWGDAGYSLPDEINRRRYVRGTVGMPKGGKDTGGCQIFITHVPTPHLDGNYTVFGQVISGLDVIDATEIGDRILRATVK